LIFYVDIVSNWNCQKRQSAIIKNAKAGTIMDNAYTYDAVSNVLSVKNGSPLPQRGKAGGQMSHSYTYDALYRLASATGTYTGADSKTASYTLAMGYDNMHRITSKKQHLTQQNVQFNGTLNAGYDLTYTYQDSTGHKFQLANVQDLNYRTEGTADENDKVNNGHRYIYDANGERTVKTSGEGEHIYVNDCASRGQCQACLNIAEAQPIITEGNSEFAGGRTNTAKFSLYVSPYLVANQGGRYTNHIYIGSQRIVSKLGDFASYGSDPRRIAYAGSEADAINVDYKNKYASQQLAIKDNYATFNVPYNGEDNNDYVNGEGLSYGHCRLHSGICEHVCIFRSFARQFCCNDGSMEAAQAKAMAANVAGAKAVSGNLTELNLGVARQNASKLVLPSLAQGFKENDDYGKMQFYYHPDHLGSSSYITNLDGEVAHHIEYVPFGEVFIEERNNTWNTPYLFNAKELDEETGMYYYGARYYEPRVICGLVQTQCRKKLQILQLMPIVSIIL